MNIGRHINRTESDVPVDITPYLERRSSEALQILQAIRDLQTYKPYQTLQRLVLSGLEKAVITQLQASKGEATIGLQGELRMIRKFVNLEQLAEIYQVELESIKQRIKQSNGKKA